MASRRASKTRRPERSRRPKGAPRDASGSGAPAEGAAPSLSRRARDGQLEPRHLVGIGAGLTGLVLLAFHRVVFFGATFVERDAIRMTLPSREFLASSLRQGRLPEWFDGVGLGAPFAANPVHETLAPLGWTMALLPIPLGSDLYTLGHLALAGLGTAALSRRMGAGPLGSLLAGGALALSGYATSMIPNGLVPALAWTPWVGWAAARLAVSLDRSSTAMSWAVTLAGAVFAAVFALQLPAGEPASILTAALVAWIVVLNRTSRRLQGTAVLLAAAAVSFVLAAFAVLPGARLLLESARGADLDQGGLGWSLHPARLVEMVWPAAFGSQHVDGWFAGLLLREGPGDPFWSYSLFLGLPVFVAIAVAARERLSRRMVLAGLPFLLLAAGSYTPLYRLVLLAVPPVRWINFPEKFIFGTLVLWAAAAGVGFTSLLSVGATRRTRGVVVAATALLALGVTALAISRSELASGLARRAEEWGVLVHSAAGVEASLAGGLVATGGAALFAGGLALHRRARRTAVGALCLAVLGPLVWAAPRVSPLAPRSILVEVPKILVGLVPLDASSTEPRPRIFRLEPRDPSGPFSGGEEIARHYHESLDTNVAARFGFNVIPGFEPAESEKMRRFGTQVFPRMAPAAFVELLGVEWIAAKNPEELGSTYPVASRGQAGWGVLDVGEVRPRAFVAPRWRSAGSPEGALSTLALAGRELDPGSIALVRPEGSPPPSRAALSECRVQVPRPEEVHLACDSLAGGHAVLLEELTPGWSATVDGRPVAPVLADGLFRAVPVGPGPREVVFRYRTPGLRTGFAISALAWVLWGGLIALGRRRRSVDS